MEGGAGATAEKGGRTSCNKIELVSDTLLLKVNLASIALKYDRKEIAQR